MKITPKPNKAFITVHKANRFPGHWTYVYAPNKTINKPNIIFNVLSIFSPKFSVLIKFIYVAVVTLSDDYTWFRKQQEIGKKNFSKT